MNKSQLYKQIGREVRLLYWSDGSIYEVSYNIRGKGRAFLDVEEIPGDSGYRNVFYIVIYVDGKEVTRFNCDQLAGWVYAYDSTASPAEQEDK